MTHRQNDPSAFPMNALSEYPQPKAGAKRITGLTRHSGKVTGYQLSDGRIVNRAEGVGACQARRHRRCQRIQKEGHGIPEIPAGQHGG